MSTDRIILDYNDSLLHGSDLHLLQPNNWLNDRIIGFVYEYYEREFFAEIVQKQKITLVNPSTVQFLKLCESLDEAIMCFFEPLELDKKNFIFFPLNNSVVTDAAGGSHWSLGLLNRKTSTFSHYDSFGGSNSSEAVKFFQKFKAYFKIDKFVDEKEFPQQQNTSDCGVYVIGAAEMILKSFDSDSNGKLDFGMLKPEYINNLRIRIKDIIIKLSKSV